MEKPVSFDLWGRKHANSCTKNSAGRGEGTVTDLGSLLSHGAAALLLGLNICSRAGTNQCKDWCLHHELDCTGSERFSTAITETLVFEEA